MDPADTIVTHFARAMIERGELLLDLGSLHHLTGVAIALRNGGLVMSTVGRIAELRTRLRWMELRALVNG